METAQMTRKSSLEQQLSSLLTIDAEKLAYVALFVLAILTRFWDLGVRVMSHDESLHTKFSWDLYVGNGFSHTPLMHGPLLFHMTALNYLLFGDNDFTSRIYPAVIGVIVVMLPYFLRKWLGRLGALAASFFFLISPLILYYSRYIRHDLPAILFALVMALAIWRYIEERQFKWLVILAAAQALLFASKEVSFIYIAIFGSFLAIYFVMRLLDAPWDSSNLRIAFVISLIGFLLSVLAFGVVFYLQGQLSNVVPGIETVSPLDPNATPSHDITTKTSALNWSQWGAVGLLTVFALGALIAALIGQWRNLRRFPEFDVLMVIGTLILPMLSPLLIHSAGFDPVDQSDAGVQTSAFFTIPVALVSVLLGLAWGMERPACRVGPTDADDEAIDENDLDGAPVDFLDWLQAFFSSRWWAVGGVFWAIFIFFFTTMFTSGSGLATGVVGSLGYWLAQQEVERGSQPVYYYVLVLVPVYEFLPLILSIVAAFLGLGRLFRPREPRPLGFTTDVGEDELSFPRAEPPEGESVEIGRRVLDFDAPITFPVLPFIGYWATLNFVAYSLAGEKMPWLTTHLATPMILLGGWVVGRLLEHTDWRALVKERTWPLLALLPLLGVTLIRVVAPLCMRRPNSILCTVFVPSSYIQPILHGQSQAALAATSIWITALLVLLGALIFTLVYTLRVGLAQTLRLAALLGVAGLSFLTAQAAWRAAYINYDNATEYLVYAHSAGAVKVVLDQIEEVSLRTTDGYDVRVAFDNRVSWPYSWYLRDYRNAVYYGDQPSRGLIGDAPVVLAGPDNWNKVEAILGDRYYQFEYIRMWWPMQDYFDLTGDDIRNFFNNSVLQQGVWKIFLRRDYTVYGQAVGRDFTLTQWPVAERMRFYIRKDVFAQVWDYGVAASEIAEATDPYADGYRELTPVFTFGGLGSGPGQLDHPHAIAFGPDGLLYIADTNNHRVSVFDTAGNFITSFGSYGSGAAAGALNEPWGLDVSSDGVIYVADTWNHRVQSFTLDGQYLASWGFEGPLVDDPFAFWGPRALAVDGEGTIYVADTGNKRIQVFDPNGEYVRQVGSGGALEGQLDEPVGIDIGPDGRIFVADTWNQRIEVFSPEGVYLNQWPISAWYAQTNERPYLHVDNQGNVYVSDPEGFRILVFSDSGLYLYSFGDYATLTLAGPMVTDGEGFLYVVDIAASAIQCYDIRLFAPPVQ